MLEKFLEHLEGAHKSWLLRQHKESLDIFYGKWEKLN